MTQLSSHLQGIVTVLNTPFSADDRLDIESLQKHILNALEAGVAGFLVPAMAAEVSKLSESERILMAQTTVQTVNGRVPVIGGASAPTSEERERYARQLIDVGCQGILASIPFVDEADYEEQVWQLADLKPSFIMLQDWDFQGYGLPLSLIVRLFKTIPAFQSIKIEVVPAGVKYSEVIQATQGKLHVAGGWAVTQMIEALDRGVHTLMPTGMHRIYTRIDELYRMGKRDEAKALFYRVLPILSFSNQHLDISIHFFKRLLHQQGLYATANVRSPILPFDPCHERIATELIDDVQAILAELPPAY